jgi:hypothetical protein
MSTAIACAAVLIAGACAGDAPRQSAGAAVPMPMSTAGMPAPLRDVASPDFASVPSTAPAAVPPSAAPNQAPIRFSEPPPERTGVAFEWKETDPSSAGTCKPGHYVGEYMCRLYIITMDGDGAFDVSGSVDMQLEQSSQGEFLRVQNGTFTSATLAAIPLEANIVGELDCSASKFEGRLENGTFSVALGLPVPFTQGTFSGPLTGSYAASTSTMSGTWNMTGELDGFPGSCMNGSWSAKWLE